MSITDRLANGILGIFQGAALFAGFALGFNMLIYGHPNMVFVLVLMFLGVLVGAVVGLVVLKLDALSAMMMMGGSILTGLFFGLLVLAFDYLFFTDSPHFEWIMTSVLLCTAPGVLVGWFISTQLGGGLDGGRRSESPEEERGSPVRPDRPSVVRSSFSNDATVIDNRLQQEVQQLSREFDNVQLDRVSGTAGAQCVSLRLAARDRVYRLFLVCPPNYPYVAPQLMIEKINPRRPEQGEEVHYLSQTIIRWEQRATLVDIVHEVAQDLLGYR